MNYDSDAASLLRFLTYTITIVPERFILDDAVAKIDRIIDNTRARVSSAQYLAAVREALACSDNLSEVIGLEHSDAAIRAFLKIAEQRLTAQIATP